MLQRGQGDHGLERRARRIGGGQRLVEQRLVVVVGQRPVLGAGQALDEAVGVEAGRRKQAQDVAGAAVHHHRRAAVLAEHLQRAVLDVGVQRQRSVLARRRRDVAAGVLAHHPALGSRPRPSGRPACRAGRRSQRLLDPLLADAEARIEQHRVGVRARPWSTSVVRDLGDVADHMGEGAAERIDPGLAHVGLTPGSSGVRTLMRANSSQVRSSATATGHESRPLGDVAADLAVAFGRDGGPARPARPGWPRCPGSRP